MKMVPALVRHAMLLCLVAGSAVALTACDRESEAQRKVSESSRTLVALTGGGSAPAHPADQQKAFSAVSAAATVDGATEGEKAAAALLASVSYDGLGGLTTAEIGTLEGKVRASIVSIQGLLTQWTSFGAIATAADAVDVSGEIAGIAASRAERDRELVALTRTRGEIEAKLNDLKGKSQAKLAQADLKFAEAATIRERAANLSATDATPLVEQAAATRREGEGLRVEGMRFKAEADTIAPTLRETLALIDKGNKQKEDLVSIEASVQARSAAAKQEATAARTAASEAAAALQRQLTELDALRSGELANAYDSAQAAFGKAVSNARAAQGAGKASAGKLAAGTASMSLAHSHWSRAQGAQSYAALLGAMAGAKPSLPNHSEIQSRLTATIQEQKAALGEAEKALDDAKSAFSSAGVQGAARERLEALTALLDKAIQTAKDEKLDAAGAFGFRSRVPAPLPASGAAPEAAPGAAAPAGDAAAQIRALLKPMVDAQTTMRVSLAKAEEACQAKFGKSFRDVLATNPMMAAAGGQFDRPEVKLEDIRVNVTGDTATATFPGAPVDVPFTKVDGAWTSQIPLGAGMNRMLSMVTKAIEGWTSDVTGDKFEDEKAAGQGLMTRFVAMQMQMQGDGK
ncbi:MAG: hypothetical protein IT433_11180 [Phycisphaerales bacterium]|nr:hypothetical protein [Phycisphaerales bacterium]